MVKIWCLNARSKIPQKLPQIGKNIKEDSKRRRICAKDNEVSAKPHKSLHKKSPENQSIAHTKAKFVQEKELLDKQRYSIMDQKLLQSQVLIIRENCLKMDKSGWVKNDFFF